MKVRLFTLFVIVGLLAALFGFPQPVGATSYGTQFVSSIVYMNVGSAAAELSFLFYSEGSGTPVAYPSSGTLSLARYAAGSLYAGTVFPSTSFQGSVTVSSTQPLAVTGVQTPPTGGAVKTRMMSNGFSAGAPTMTIPSVRRTAAQNSVFSVQNADGVAGDLTVAFYLPGNATPVATDVISNLPAGSAKFYDMGTSFSTTSGSVPSTFDGSVVVSAVQHGTSVAGAVVAASQEFDLAPTNYKAYAFSATAGGATKVYMPSAFCQYNQGATTAGPINTYYAFTNSSDAAINITVTYAHADMSGNPVSATETFTNVAPGNKAVSNGCASTGTNVTGPLTGSASAVASWYGTPGTGSPSMVAVGKVTGYGYSTAFEGVPDPGPTSVALPYVRYASGSQWTAGSRQRVFLAIQNVGTTELATNSVRIDYYNDAGTLMGTHYNSSPIPVNGKFGDNAGSIDANFGYWTSTVGGGAIVTGPTGSKLAVLARAQTYDSSNSYLWSEDYIGIPMP